MLTFITTIDNGLPCWYSLTGDLIDHDGKAFTVGESGAKFDAVFGDLCYYVNNFDNVEVAFTFETLVY